MKRWKNINRLCLGMIGLLLGLTGCAGPSDTKETTYGPNTVALYYPNADQTALVTRYVELEESGTVARVQAVLKELGTPPENGKNPLQNMAKTEADVAGDTVILHFTSEYNKMKPAEEILGRAAVVKALTELQGISYVEFYIANQPMVDRNGIQVGPMSGEEYEMALESEIGELTTTLYFTDETGEMLVKEERTISYPIGENVAYYVAQEVLKGTSEPGHQPVWPSSVHLQEAVTKTGICYLYFAADFMENKMNVDAQIPIYALVNSIAELPGISRVQFVIEGNVEPVFRDEISLVSALTGKLELVKKE